MVELVSEVALGSTCSRVVSLFRCVIVSLFRSPLLVASLVDSLVDGLVNILVVGGCP